MVEQKKRYKKEASAKKADLLDWLLAIDVNIRLNKNPQCVFRRANHQRHIRLDYQTKRRVIFGSKSYC